MYSSQSPWERGGRGGTESRSFREKNPPPSLVDEAPTVCLCCSLLATSSPHRSIIWLQRRRDEILERLRGSSGQRKEDQHELQIGRLRQDRVRIPREDDVSGDHTDVRLTTLMSD